MIMKRTLASGALAAMLIGTLASSPSVAVETGQLLDKGPRWPNNKITRTIGSAECPGSACTLEVINEAEQRGQITPKEAKALRKIQSNPPSVDKGNSARVKTTSGSAGGGTSGWVLPVAGALAVGAGVLAVATGNNNAASPN